MNRTPPATDGKLGLSSAEIMAAAARLRWRKPERMTEHTCPHCGTVFTGPVEKVYCTPAHRNAAGQMRFRAAHRN